MREPLEQTLSSRLAAMRMTRDGGMPEDMLAIVDLAMAAAGMEGDARIAAAARSLFDASCVLKLSGAAARDALGVEDDGRGTAFSVWEQPGAAGAAAVLFEFEAARRAAAACFSAADEPPSSCLGLPLPQEVSVRLRVARDRPALGEHYILTAADHMAAHVMTLVSELEGVAVEDGRACWAGSFAPGGAKDALAWLSVPGPGAFAASVAAFLPREPGP